MAAGFAIGMLSLQRADQRQKRFEMEAIAESRAHQLGRERAEVERLRKVDLARTEFVGVAAHELRTPLAAILGVLTTLRVPGRASGYSGSLLGVADCRCLPSDGGV